MRQSGQYVLRGTDGNDEYLLWCVRSSTAPSLAPWRARAEELTSGRASVSTVPHDRLTQADDPAQSDLAQPDHLAQPDVGGAVRAQVAHHERVDDQGAGLRSRHAGSRLEPEVRIW